MANPADGSEFQVNTFTVGDQDNVAIARDAAGNFVVVWESTDQDGDQDGIYAQRFDSSGNRLGNEFQVNTFTRGNQSDPAVAMDATGNFIIAWIDAGRSSSINGGTGTITEEKGI
jgi:hypothetical protein